MEINKMLNTLKCIADENGPTQEEYNEFIKMLNIIGNEMKENEISQDVIFKIKSKVNCLKDNTYLKHEPEDMN